MPYLMSLPMRGERIMFAMITKYHAPNETQGARIVVTSQRGRKTVAWDYAIGHEENHRNAANIAAGKWGVLAHYGGIESGMVRPGEYAHIVTQELA